MSNFPFADVKFETFFVPDRTMPYQIFHLLMKNLNTFFLQKRFDEDCITELAVHFKKTRKQIEEEVSEVNRGKLSPEIFIDEHV